MTDQEKPLSAALRYSRLGFSVAALFVMSEGPYFGLDGVDPWDESRDARKYEGPYPVVAHPPCARWGRYWSGGPSAKVKRQLGDDNGCFASALESVRKWGGVLEHPEGSHAWRHHGLFLPPKRGGWIPAGDGIGHTCCVEQGNYGHRARKATWLYAVRAERPSLLWGKSPAKMRLDDGWHHGQTRSEARAKYNGRITTYEMEATPVPFRDLLISLARTVALSSAEVGR